MASCKRQYVLYVGSADLTVWPESIHEPQEFYMEIILDKMEVKTTQVVKGGEALSWNEQFTLGGTTESTIYLSLVRNQPWSTTQGFVNIELGKLLSICADNQLATLEITSTGPRKNQPIIGVLKVKLSEQADIDVSGITMDTSDEGQIDRFKRLNNTSNVEKTISSEEGTTFYVGLFEDLGDLSDIENAILSNQKAVHLTGDEHPKKAIYLSNLGNSQKTRFEHLGDLSDLENAISNQQKAVHLTSEGYPNQAIYLSNLGDFQQSRFENLGELSDLENAISNTQKAVQLTGDEHPNKAIYLSNLGNSQHTRFVRLGDLFDLENVISNQQKAVQLAGDGDPNKGMYLSNLGNSLQTRFEELGDVSDLQNAVFNNERAVHLTGDEHPEKSMYLANLGSSQLTLFERINDLSDLENAISSSQKAVHLTCDTNPNKARYLATLGSSQNALFKRFGDVSDLENAISNNEKAVYLTGDTNPNKAMYLSNLGNSQEARYGHFGGLSDLANAISNKQKAVRITAYSLLTRFIHLGDLFDLENAISNQQEAVHLTGDTHANKGMYLTNLGNSQLARFRRVGDLSDLENAISNNQMAVRLTGDTCPNKSLYLSSLGNAQRTRFQHLGDSDDLAACVLSYTTAAQLKAAYPSHALRAARRGAQMSHRNGDLMSALDSYRTALNLFSKVSWLGLNTRTRQDLLLREKPENLACLAATCAIQLGHLEEAVELLDLGRSVFWQQATSLRSDFEMLREEDAELAERLDRIGQQLDTGNFYGSCFTTGELNIRDDPLSAEKIGRERRRLVGEWEGLVEKVRELPQFEFFLKPIPFHQLRRASRAGQLIIINTSAYGVDALIFGATGPIVHMSLPDVNLGMLTELSRNIVLNQDSNGSEMQQRKYITRFLKPALRTVWNDILVHIFDKIQIPLEDTLVLPRHRIWWYLTGPLAFIPIHAAGCGALDVSRLVISSYVTTLESLLRAQKKYVTVSKEHQKFLFVSQPETADQTSLPQTTEEVNDVVQIFCSSGWSKENMICLSGPEATVDAVSTALNSCSWIHLACHGFQDSKLGLRSAFALHNGHLALGEIASKRLSNGLCAFLSACHAASGQKDLPGEAMHLAAGLQFAGFSSVIATMWRIRDTDAPNVAYHTYQFLLQNGPEELDPSAVALALNHAILRLREDPSVTVDRWALFIHFGI